MDIKQKTEDKDIRLIVFQGSWCPMCVSAMPQIANFLQKHSFDESRVDIINVNRFKTKPKEEIKKYNISRVPTIVFLSDGEEKERITEYAPSGWVKDIEEKIELI
ncbi:MAG: thioredoxin family protein [Chlorobiota bacterium]